MSEGRKLAEAKLIHPHRQCGRHELHHNRVRNMVDKVLRAHGMMMAKREMFGKVIGIICLSWTPYILNSFVVLNSVF